MVSGQPSNVSFTWVESQQIPAIHSEMIHLSFGVRDLCCVQSVLCVAAVPEP